MKISANNISIGDVLEYEGGLYSVLKTSHTQPGKGGAFVQVEMKEINNSTKRNMRLRSTESVEKAYIDSTPHTFLYINGDMVELMNNESYEQISLPKDLFGDALGLLADGMIVSVKYHDEKPISISPPDSINVEIAECEPFIKGQTATSSYKTAKIKRRSVCYGPTIHRGWRYSRDKIRYPGIY